MGKQPATYQDVIDAPDGITAEIIGGELFLMARPATAHAFTSLGIARRLATPFEDGDGDGPGGWVFLIEPELWLGPSDTPNSEVLVPDIAGWRRERFCVPTTTHGHVRPDWVCETLSPTTARKDRILKLAVYARERIGHAWIVDPLDETVEVYGLRDDGVYAFVASAMGDVEARLPPFDAVTLPLTRCWVRSLETEAAPATAP